MSDNSAADISGVFVTQSAHQGFVKPSGGKTASPLHFFFGGRGKCISCEGIVNSYF